MGSGLGSAAGAQQLVALHRLEAGLGFGEAVAGVFLLAWMGRKALNSSSCQCRFYRERNPIFMYTYSVCGGCPV